MKQSKERKMIEIETYLEKRNWKHLPFLTGTREVNSFPVTGTASLPEPSFHFVHYQIGASIAPIPSLHPRTVQR